jgi:hypothetical protein
MKSSELNDNNLQDMLYFLKGDQWAVQFLVDLLYIIHVWDDLIDKDKKRSDGEINDAFKKCFIDIPSNPFYEKYRYDLRPLILNMILQWEDANTLDHGSDHDKHMAFMLRAGYFQIVNYCAYLTGGADWARRVGPQARRLYGEDLNDYMKEMEKCQTRYQD